MIYRAAESWSRRLFKLKEQGRINHITIILDRDVITRHREKLRFIQAFCDEIHFLEIHAKLILLESEKKSVVDVMSYNATTNYRIETYYISDSHEDIKTIRADLHNICQ